MIFAIDKKFVEVALNESRCLGVESFQIPKDSSDYKDWIHATRCPVDDLPSKSLYVQTILKRNHKDHQIGRRLLPGSIPTFLPHKKDNKPHLSSEKRALAQRKEEGIYFFNKVISKVSSLKLQTLRLLLYWKKKNPVIAFFQGFCLNFENFET